MTFPVIEATATTSDTTNSVTVSHNLPASIAADELLMIFAWCNGTSDFNTPSGWTALYDSSGAPVAGCFYKTATGSEGATVDLTINGSGEEQGSVSMRISGIHASSAPEVSTVASGTSTSPNPGSLNPSGWDVEDTLWLAALHVDHDAGGETIDSYPTSYTQAAEVVVSGWGAVAVGERDLRAASDDPGAFTISASQKWKAYTIAIRPSVAGGGGGDDDMPQKMLAHDHFNGGMAA